ncbi:MAG: SDR family NAD(P)-dependent oxidoreductase [Candidatus Sumerlaeaceae bacterium]|nr:SDR family NAD(P)-dependent oxidoreductase [Candidatus Sumerlaeaceae bacterium]
MLKDKCAVVVGASSGIGAAVAVRLGRAGYRVALVARREEELKRLAGEINQRAGEERAFVFAHDASHFDEVPTLFDRIAETLGGMTMLVYAAGVMPKVEPEEYNFAKDRQMVEVNLLGMMAWGNAAAELFARLQSGVIVGVGSIAGDRGRKGQPGYNTSKGAQAIYLESLRNRLASKNVRVVTIKPGYVDTAMVRGMGNLLWMISADEAGRRIVAAAETARGTVYVPRRWRFVSLILTHIPSFIFKKLDI